MVYLCFFLLFTLLLVVHEMLVEFLACEISGCIAFENLLRY